MIMVLFHGCKDSRQRHHDRKVWWSKASYHGARKQKGKAPEKNKKGTPCSTYDHVSMTHLDIPTSVLY